MASITRIFDIPYYQLERNNKAICFATKRNGKWINTSTKEYIDQANAVSRALLHLGIQKNDKIAVISSTNRSEWNIMEIGILQTGAQNVPVYPTIAESDYEYILNHCEAQYCFISDESILEKINSIRHNLPHLKEIYSFDPLNSIKNWKELLEIG